MTSRSWGMIAAMADTASPDLFQALGHDVADKRIDILRRIGAGGSISQAARDAGVSYKAAWQALDTLTNLAGVALVERAVGGAGGGGVAVAGSAGVSQIWPTGGGAPTPVAAGGGPQPLG